MIKYGDIITQIEKESVFNVKLSKEDQEHIDNHYKMMDEIIEDAVRLYGNHDKS